MSFLELSNATLGYFHQPVLRDLNLRITPGEWITIVGPNGSGKSTLLKGLIGLLKPVSGKREASYQRAGYVPQRFHCPPEAKITVAEFLSLQALGRTPYQLEIAEQCAIVELFETPIKNLSGGELQRVILAFALWDKPEILYLDEYTDSIDFDARDSITSLLERLSKKENLTVIEVSHDLESVQHTASRVLVLKHAVLFDGSPHSDDYCKILENIYDHRHSHHHPHSPGGKGR